MKQARHTTPRLSFPSACGDKYQPDCTSDRCSLDCNDAMLIKSEAFDYLSIIVSVEDDE